MLLGMHLVAQLIPWSLLALQQKFCTRTTKYSILHHSFQRGRLVMFLQQLSMPLECRFFFLFWWNRISNWNIMSLGSCSRPRRQLENVFPSRFKRLVLPSKLKVPNMMKPIATSTFVIFAEVRKPQEFLSKYWDTYNTYISLFLFGYQFFIILKEWKWGCSVKSEHDPATVAVVQYWHSSYYKITENKNWIQYFLLHLLQFSSVMSIWCHFHLNFFPELSKMSIKIGLD
jgi:hypothetical protein